MKFTKKQKNVFECYLKDNPRILITSGAKRAGKTFVMLFIFLHHINKYKNQGLSFILGGVNQSAIRRNILDDLELILGKELRLDMTNAIEIFGNNVYCFDGANADSWKKVRGFTAAGALLNEGTALHDSFIKEVISRCSHEGARVFIDTNPENPVHPVKTDYIDKSGQRLESGQLNIQTFHFSLFDNDTLNDEYVESIVKSTPSGMFTDRDIYGRWVSAEGIVYQDFDHNRHYISPEEIEKKQFVEHFAGVDWGYKHHGSIVVMGITDQGEYIMLEEHAYQYKFIDFWIQKATEIKERYGDIVFYCDNARPEYIDDFIWADLNAVKASDERLSGVESVATLFKQNKLHIIDTADRFKEEVNLYVWNERTGQPIQEHDDVLDSLRYAIYSNKTNKPTVKTYRDGF